jgi:glycosyltransferase involved in cell wall biosynthesis
MNIAFYIIAYNRPNMLSKSISTAINNTSVKPNEIWIVDDGSTPDVKSALLNYSIENSSKIPINLLIHGVNLGIGYSFERVYNLIRQNDELDIACSEWAYCPRRSHIYSLKKMG